MTTVSSRYSVLVHEMANDGKEHDGGNPDAQQNEPPLLFGDPLSRIIGIRRFHRFPTFLVLNSEFNLG